ncbi:MAG: 2-amino-4-hydroxy-6-hydroxymethyldihydropteridine diphosphokinase [Desulfobacteraceae bacterium 4484_190.1]|nr:MAG: 2-amino-4-hydroxy-6-hydroxymethyldihydropteridine diphosphokinase [Desulfobacteraceae bacterium 4484_190.1]
MMKTAYIGVGSNLGDKINNCLEAVIRIDEIPGCRVTAQSGFYRTQPVGVKGQDWYVNGVIVLSADISAQDLLKNLLAIEIDMGRERKRKWDSRIIDLDILLFGEEVISEKGLQVPHPLMHLRRFVLVPMVSLAPDLIHPMLGKSMAELLVDSPEKEQSVVPMGVA